MHPQDDGERGTIEKMIEPWFRRNVAFPDVKRHGRCDLLTLRHLNLSKQPQGDVGTFPVKLEEGAEGEFSNILAEVADAAQQDADDVNQGVQTYALYAQFPQDKNYVPRKVFRVAARDVETERDLSPSEPADARGLVAQTMRHLEVTQRTATVVTTELLRYQQQQIERLAAMNEKFSEQQIDFLVLVQDLLDKRHERRLNERDHETGLALKESALTKLDVLLPIIVNRLAGKQVLPEDNASLMLMGSLLENLDDQQQLAILGNLTDAQKMAFAEVIANYEKQKGKWLRGQKKIVLGTENSLVPTKEPGDSSSPLPTSMTLRERMTLPSKSEDPLIQKIEEDGERFGSHFLDLIKKPTTNNGDPR